MKVKLIQFSLIEIRNYGSLHHTFSTIQKLTLYKQPLTLNFFLCSVLYQLSYERQPKQLKSLPPAKAQGCWVEPAKFFGCNVNYRTICFGQMLLLLLHSSSVKVWMFARGTVRLKIWAQQGLLVGLQMHASLEEVRQLWPNCWFPHMFNKISSQLSHCFKLNAWSLHLFSV